MSFMAANEANHDFLLEKDGVGQLEKALRTTDARTQRSIAECVGLGDVFGTR